METTSIQLLLEMVQERMNAIDKMMASYSTEMDGLVQTKHELEALARQDDRLRAIDGPLSVTPLEPTPPKGWDHG